jgi:hypothetical protein
MRHAWDLLGGGGGWEIWQCEHCKRERTPVPIFGLWRPWGRCRVP